MIKKYLNIQLEIVTNEETEIDRLVKGIVENSNGVYSTGTYFELLGYSIEEKLSILDNKPKVTFVEETVSGKNILKDQEKYNLSSYAGTIKNIEDIKKYDKFNPIINQDCHNCKTSIIASYEDFKENHLINGYILCHICKENWTP